MDIFKLIKAGIDNTKLVDWPKSTEKVVLKILSEQDHQDAAFETERLFKYQKIDTSLITSDEYESEKATQILYRALRNPKNLDEKVTPSITDFRKNLTRKEKECLIEEYLAFEREVSPSPENLSSEEFDRIVSDIKKNAGTANLKDLSLNTLRKLVITLASDHQKELTTAQWLLVIGIIRAINEPEEFRPGIKYTVEKED